MTTGINPLRAATLSVAALAPAIARYRDWLDYRVIETGALDRGVADGLGAPAAAGAPFALLRPGSGRAIDLRLVESPAVAGFKPSRTYGWAAIELCVQDAPTVYERLRDGPFEIVGRPSLIADMPGVRSMQVFGPDGEVIFLTEVQGGPGTGLPVANAMIDAPFIAVLACRDMPATAQWAADRLGLVIGPPMKIPYRTISHAFGFTPDRLIEFSTASGAGETCLELDQYPDEATERSRTPGRLAPGFAAITLMHDRIDAIVGPWAAQPARRDGALYEGRRVGVLETPEGALVEIVEGDTVG